MEEGLTDEELKDIVKELNIDKIRKDVFHLYGIKVKLDTQLSLRKI